MCVCMCICICVCIYIIYIIINIITNRNGTLLNQMIINADRKNIAKGYLLKMRNQMPQTVVTSEKLV